MQTLHVHFKHAHLSAHVYTSSYTHTSTDNAYDLSDPVHMGVPPESIACCELRPAGAGSQQQPGSIGCQHLAPCLEAPCAAPFSPANSA